MQLSDFGENTNKKLLAVTAGGRICYTDRKEKESEAVRIINFGSLNIDKVYRVEQFVRPGQTITAKDCAAIAVSRTGTHKSSETGQTESPKGVYRYARYNRTRRLYFLRPV